MNQNQTGEYNPLNQSQPTAAPQTPPADPNSQQPMAPQRPPQTPPNTPAESKFRKVPIILGALTIAAFSGIGWVAYESGLKSTNNNVPVVQAESTVVKVKPENAEGHLIPHQDKKVYSQIEKTPSAQKPAPHDFSKKVHLSEAPLDITTKPAQQQSSSPSASPASTKTPAPKTETITIQKNTQKPVPIKEIMTAKNILAPIQTIEKKNTPTPKKVAQTTSPKQAQTPETPAEKPKAFSFSSYTKNVAPSKTTPKPQTQKTATKKPSATPLTPQTASTAATLTTPSTQTAMTSPTGSFMIQVGAVKSDAIAHTEWQRLNKKFPEQFRNIHLKTEQVTVNGSTLHRIRGGMMNKNQATSICTELKANNIPCFVIKKK